MCSIIGFSSTQCSPDLVQSLFRLSTSRGPDQSRFQNVGNNNYLGFNRLAIMDPKESGMQPFHLDGDSVVCNGEIYDFRPLKGELKNRYCFSSESDCEVLLPLWKEKGVEMFRELDALEEVVSILGTWDITTIRASMGMYLCCKAIHENTDVKVLLTGEISDELFCYKYTDFAPDAEAFQKEAEKRIRELHYYDVLRADRCISDNSLEARVPFGDLEFVRYVMAIDPEMKMNRYNMGKYLLRKAFADDHILPDEILWRQKAAFSDAVGHSMVDGLKEYAQKLYTDAEFEEKSSRYEYHRPFTKESLLYRELFEKHYPGQADMIPDYWMPNRSWKGCDVDDPSARVLSNYGASGI